jgi:hypothetical protein
MLLDCGMIIRGSSTWVASAALLLPPLRNNAAPALFEPVGALFTPPSPSALLLPRLRAPARAVLFCATLTERAPSQGCAAKAALISAEAQERRWRSLRRNDVQISRGTSQLLDARVHLFRVDDAVRLAQLFAQALGRRIGLGARCGLIGRRTGRLGEGPTGDEADAGDNHAKP